MYTQLEEMNLVSDLLYTLGLSVNITDNVLLDQETNKPIIFEGKNIKATRNPAKPAYISENDVKLEPANPKCTKLMSKLFGFFLDRETEANNIPKVLTFFFDDVDIEKGLVKLVVKYENGTSFETQPRRSKALLYTEAILEIDGSFPIDNLDNFDIDEDVDIRR